MTLSPSSSTNFSRTLPFTCCPQRLWKLQPRTTRMSRFWEVGGDIFAQVNPRGLHLMVPPGWSCLGEPRATNIRPRGSLGDSCNSEEPLWGRPIPVSPNAMGIRSHGTLSAGIDLDDPGPHGRVCFPCPQHQGNEDSEVPPVRPLPQWPRGSPPLAEPVSGRQAAAGGPGAGRQAPSGVWKRPPGPKAGLGQ